MTGGRILVIFGWGKMIFGKKRENLAFPLRLLGAGLGEPKPLWRREQKPLAAYRATILTQIKSIFSILQILQITEILV